MAASGERCQKPRPGILACHMSSCGMYRWLTASCRLTNAENLEGVAVVHQLDERDHAFADGCVLVDDLRRSRCTHVGLGK